MGTWHNGDGLFVKFGRSEADGYAGMEYGALENGTHVIEFDIDYREALSATAAILGSVLAPGNRGILVPKGAIAEKLEIRASTAFTSSGTIGSADLTIGLIKASDRSTAYDVDEYTTSSFVLGVLDATSEGPTTDNTVRVGTTGAGDGYGVATTENALICVANSAHATHPLTAGVAKCRLFYRFGL